RSQSDGVHRLVPTPRGGPEGGESGTLFADPFQGAMSSTRALLEFLLRHNPPRALPPNDVDLFIRFEYRLNRYFISARSTPCRR
ncbi:hypothetical protein N7454_010613, partial [Penicillium verhagenii]